MFAISPTIQSSPARKAQPWQDIDHPMISEQRAAAVQDEQARIAAINLTNHRYDQFVYAISCVMMILISVSLLASVGWICGNIAAEISTWRPAEIIHAIIGKEVF